MSETKNVVRVSIAGEDYTIRTVASLEHTRSVAQYVDGVIRQIQSGGAVVESHKAAMLAALQIADQLYRSRQRRGEVARDMRTLAADVRRWLPASRDVPVVEQVAVER